MALPARHALNMVYVDLLRGMAKEEDITDLENWLSCTVDEAEAWQRQNEVETMEERLRLARMAGTVVI